MTEMNGHLYTVPIWVGTSNVEIEMLVATATQWTVIQDANDCTNCVGTRYDTSTSTQYLAGTTTEYSLYNQKWGSVVG